MSRAQESRRRPLRNKDRAAPMRKFATGAYRDQDRDKHDFDGFFSPLMFDAFGTYMHFNRTLADGSVRESNNWQKGIELEVYRKSLWRHWHDVNKFLQGYKIKENILWAACAVIFNTQGIIHELMKKHPTLLDECREQMQAARAKKSLRRKHAR